MARLVSFRLPEELDDCLIKQARVLGTTKTYILVQTLTQVFTNMLPPGYDPGRPTRDWGEGVEGNDEQEGKER